MSPLGLTTSQLTSAHLVAHDDAVALVREAVRLGVDVIDTAPLYGLGEAEYIVGKALEPLADRIFLMGKIGRFEKSIVSGHGTACYRSPALISAQFEHSLRLLRRDRLDLLLLHESDWPEWWEPGAEVRGPVLDLLDRLREQGRIGGTGMFPSDPSQAPRLCGSGRFDALLFRKDMHVVRQAPLAVSLESARSQNMGVAVAASLSPSDAGRAPHGEAVQAVAREAGLSLPELGVRWLLSQEDVHTVLVGPRDRKELERAVAWAAEPPLEPALLRALADASGVRQRNPWNPEIDGAD
ncbi:aldo/keto reductase [Streptomyces sp. NPDC057027]|uniref:aldo/keto reductase n=1 Tax=Streptomyces sp. NPDC057027 TaxID=3346004 RepID=UPI003642E0AA